MERPVDLSQDAGVYTLKCPNSHILDVVLCAAAAVIHCVSVHEGLTAGKSWVCANSIKELSL